MPKEELADFSIPWAQSFINDPSWRSVPTFSRELSPPPRTQHSFFADTLFTPRCIRAVLSFQNSPQPTNPPSLIGSEARMLFSLGDGMNGWSGYSHGGFIGMMIDEVTGQCVGNLFGRDIVTGEITTRFRKRLPTPGVVLCRAWVEKEPVGRKIWIKASIEDGEGLVYATGEALYIRVKESHLKL